MLSKGIIICALLQHRNGIHNSHGLRSVCCRCFFSALPTHICHYIIEFAKKRFAHKGTLLAASNSLITLQKQSTHLNDEFSAWFCDSVALWAATRQHNNIKCRKSNDRQTYYEIKLSYFSFQKGNKTLTDEPFCSRRHKMVSGEKNDLQTEEKKCANLMKKRTIQNAADLKQ